MNSSHVALIKLFFSRGDQVEWVAPVFENRPDGVAVKGTELVRGAVETECNAREGWYYVRTRAGRVHLIHWTELLPVNT